MSYETSLGWLAYVVGLIWYVSICTMAGQLAGGHMQWVMPLAGFAGWTLAAAVVRWKMR